MQATRTLAERLQSRLELQPNRCLEFMGARLAHGYGAIGSGRKIVLLTHRVAWELANGPIPEGMFVCHHCDNPPCCQTEPTEGYPDGHLFLGTPADNAQDLSRKGLFPQQQRTQCPEGHPYDAANTCVYQGKRSCRTCRNDKKRADYWAQKDRLTRTTQREASP